MVSAGRPELEEHRHADRLGMTNSIGRVRVTMVVVVEGECGVLYQMWMYFV